MISRETLVGLLPDMFYIKGEFLYFYDSSICNKPCHIYENKQNQFGVGVRTFMICHYYSFKNSQMNRRKTILVLTVSSDEKQVIRGEIKTQKATSLSIESQVNIFKLGFDIVYYEDYRYISIEKDSVMRMSTINEILKNE